MHLHNLRDFVDLHYNESTDDNEMRRRHARWIDSQINLFQHAQLTPQQRGVLDVIAAKVNNAKLALETESTE